MSSTKKVKKPRHKIWDCFTEVREENRLKGKCRYCGATYFTYIDKMQRHILKQCDKIPENDKQKYENDKDRRLTLSTFSSSSQFTGKFCWEEIGGVAVPFIIRGSGEMLAEISMLKKTAFKKQLEVLSEEVFQIACPSHLMWRPPKYKATKLELKLLNEINSVHCDYFFSKIPIASNTFLLGMGNAVQLYQLLEVFYKVVTENKIENPRYGYILIDKSNTPIPFVDIQNVGIVVPLFFFECPETMAIKPELEYHWPLTYIKLFCKLLCVQKSFYDLNALSVVRLSDLKDVMPEASRFTFITTLPANVKIAELKKGTERTIRPTVTERKIRPNVCAATDSGPSLLATPSPMYTLSSGGFFIQQNLSDNSQTSIPSSLSTASTTSSAPILLNTPPGVFLLASGGTFIQSNLCNSTVVPSATSILSSTPCLTSSTPIMPNISHHSLMLSSGGSLIQSNLSNTLQTNSKSSYNVVVSSTASTTSATPTMLNNSKLLPVVPSAQSTSDTASNLLVRSSTLSSTSSTTHKSTEIISIGDSNPTKNIVQSSNIVEPSTIPTSSSSSAVSNIAAPTVTLTPEGLLIKNSSTLDNTSLLQCNPYSYNILPSQLGLQVVQPSGLVVAQSTGLGTSQGMVIQPQAGDVAQGQQMVQQSRLGANASNSFIILQQQDQNVGAQSSTLVGSTGNLEKHPGSSLKSRLTGKRESLYKVNEIPEPNNLTLSSCYRIEVKNFAGQDFVCINILPVRVCEMLINILEIREKLFTEMDKETFMTIAFQMKLEIFSLNSAQKATIEFYYSEVKEPVVKEYLYFYCIRFFYVYGEMKKFAKMK